MEAKGEQISAATRNMVLRMQKNEVTEFYIYQRLAAGMKEGHNREVLSRIAQEEKKHAYIWQRYTGELPAPNRFKVFWYTLLARLLGFTFAVKLMEQGEDAASASYEVISREIPEAVKIAEEEQTHERELIEILDEERLQYVGSMVLGLNDALVELTGTLAGLTFALQNNRLVALSGLITGISATLSMASSEYLSARSEGREDALKSSCYTGVMYLFAVACLVLPYLLYGAQALWPALLTMLGVVVAIILAFTYYISVAKDLPFGRRFGEMAVISLSVAALSFGIGLLVKHFLGIDV